MMNKVARSSSRAGKERNKSSSRADEKRALNESREEKSSDELSVMNKSEWSKAGQGQTISGNISADATSWCTEPSWLRSNQLSQQRRSRLSSREEVGQNDKQRDLNTQHYTD
ncbi:hypothetical protein F511_46127 [Dorcoceras hygrometricum]|uniref:Uncharacterized protein n=1 Tax=Dorcoceras hygrometricum TaxID=472368 RepID=A0A2Z7A1M5_9LAMI|nr:hypothetical protein F511_46127 [Dorcoceras hygrometricum]